MAPNDSPPPDKTQPTAEADAPNRAQSDSGAAAAESADDRFLSHLQDQVAKRQGDLDTARKRLAEYEKQKRDKERKAQAKLAGRIGDIWLKMGLTPADAEAFLKAHKGKDAAALRKAIGLAAAAGADGGAP